MFHEVESINRHLGDRYATYQLFLHLVDNSPDLARACAVFALPALIKAGDVELAKRYMTVPDVMLRHVKAQAKAPSPPSCGCCGRQLGPDEHGWVLVTTGIIAQNAAR